MGDLVDMKKKTALKILTGIGLLLVPAASGSWPASGSATPAGETQIVATETVAAVEYEPAPAGRLGTADNPYTASRPAGAAARQLISVSSETFGGTALVEIVGDGSFAYRAFQLEDPARFVLDLPGVVKTTQQASLDVEHEIVNLVRLGQYRAEPDPVSRVVFDLTAPAVPRIEPTPEGLAVSFDARSLGASFRAAPAAALAAETSMTTGRVATAGAEVAAFAPPASTDDALPSSEAPESASTVTGWSTPDEPVGSTRPEPVVAETRIAAGGTQWKSTTGSSAVVRQETVRRPSAATVESAPSLDPAEPAATPHVVQEPLTWAGSSTAAESETVLEPEPASVVEAVDVAAVEVVEVDPAPPVAATPLDEPVMELDEPVMEVDEAVEDVDEAEMEVDEPVMDEVLVAEAPADGVAAADDAVDAEIETFTASLEAEAAMETEPVAAAPIEEAEVAVVEIDAPVVEPVAMSDVPAFADELAAEGLETDGPQPGDAPRAEFQIAAAAAPEMPIVEVAPPPVVEPMPEPFVPAPDSSRFEVADVQFDEPAPAAPSASEPAASFEAQAIETERRYQGEPMDLSLQDADVKDVLRSFAQLSGLNLVVQPNVRGRVTVELVQVPWDQALEQILKINNLGYELDGNIMRIAPISTLAEEAEEQQRLLQARALSVPLSTVIRRISYAKAQEISSVLAARGGVMSNRGTVIVDRRTNTLIIKELPSYMSTVIAVIENLDIPEPQVMIEARIVETTKRFSRSLGIQWDFLSVSSAATGNTTGLQFPNNGTIDGGVNLLTGAQNGFLNLSLGNILDTFSLDATLHAAESEGLINVLSAPRVATLNNERASIQSGLQIPIQTVANNTVSVQFVNATLRLDVTPQVTAEGTILMDIDIQKREPQLAFAVAGAQNAPIATKEASTRVIVRDGGTTVIGGIYEVSTDQGEDRVPGLANIPVIKHLFKNKRRQDENEELLIFITPRVTKL